MTRGGQPPTSDLTQQTPLPCCSALQSVDSLGRGESEDVDQHDLPPDPQSGADNVSDDVGQRLHHLAVLEEIITSVLVIVRVDQPAQGDRGSGYCSSGLSSSPPPRHPSRTPARTSEPRFISET